MHKHTHTYIYIYIYNEKFKNKNMRVLILLLVAATAVAALDDGSTVTLFEVKDNICGETVNFPAKYAKLAEKFDKNLKEGTCLSVGYTQFVKNTTKKTPIGTFTVEEFKKPSTLDDGSTQAILSGSGTNNPLLEYLPDEYEVLSEINVYASGKDGIFLPGTPIGKTNDNGEVELFVDPNQLSFVTVDLIRQNKEIF